MAETTKSLRINHARLMGTIDALAAIGTIPDGGVQRLAFSEEDRQGRSLVTGWMKAAGLSIRADAAGNIIGRRAGSADLPAIAIGSHIDTVVDAGQYDGTLGVLGGLECVRTLDDGSTATRHPLELIVFTNEEGARHSKWLFGSRAMAGLLYERELDEADDEGVTVHDRLLAIDGDANQIDTVRRSPHELSAYLELHIEQGPLLEQIACPVGVVEGITGRVSIDVQVVGMANHAGTTPMDMRQDALVAAAHLITEVRRLVADEGLTRVGTVGQISIEPNVLNTVPARARLAMEFRDLSADKLAAVPGAVTALLARLSKQTNTAMEIVHASTTDSAPTSERIRHATEAAADTLRLATNRMPSGAGHDAQSMAALTEIGMIFVPSIKGISHAPQEFSSPDACANGANVLLHTILELDRP